MTPSVSTPPILAEGLMDWWVKFNFSTKGASQMARDSDALFFWVYAISAFFFILLMAMMVWFSFKYRKQAGKVPERSASHNTLLELSWSVIPTILLVWMFFKGFWGYAANVVAPSEGLTLNVVGKQWAWNATYPNGAVSSESTRTRDITNPESSDGIQDTPIFYVPVNTPITLRLSSEDVLHAFWVRDMRAKFDVFPNRYTGVWFDSDKIERTGDIPPDKNGVQPKGPDGKPIPYQDHWVFCAEYCGQNHSEMLAVFRVVPQSYFKVWMAEAAVPKGTLAERGEKYYKIKGCNSCHSIDGTKAVGPTWKNIYGHAVKFKDGTGMTDEERTGTSFANYVRESVYDPARKIVDGYPNQMQNFTGRLSQEELDCIIAYMASDKLTDKPAPVTIEETPGAPAATGATGTTGAPPPTGAPPATGAPPK